MFEFERHLLILGVCVYTTAEGGKMSGEVFLSLLNTLFDKYNLLNIFSQQHCFITDRNKRKICFIKPIALVTQAFNMNVFCSSRRAVSGLRCSLKHVNTVAEISHWLKTWLSVILKNG